jgi:hypothetical protein
VGADHPADDRGRRAGRRDRDRRGAALDRCIAHAPLGTFVNVLWVAYDLVILSVIFRAAAYRAPETDDGSGQNDAAATTTRQEHG